MNRGPDRVGDKSSRAVDSVRRARGAAPGSRQPSFFFLIRSLNLGGAERQLIYLASGLKAAGHDVTVAVYYPGILDRELEESGVRLLDLGKKGRWDLIGVLQRLVGALRRERPEILYSFLGTSNILAALARPFAPPLKLVWSVRSSFMDLTAFDRVSGWSYRVECRLSRRADLIIANSNAGADYAAAHGFPSDRIVVVSNGIDTARFRPDEAERARMRGQWGIARDEVLIGILARLDPMKDHRTFLRAAALAAAQLPQLRFVCIGSGPDDYARELTGLADNLGLARRVVWPGGVGDPVAALNALDLCCSSSTGEGFSNSIAEAMACGVPCVATDVGDTARLIGETGRVVPPADPARLAAALVEAASNLGADTRARARERIIEHFSLARLRDDTLAAISGDVSAAA